MPVDAGGLTVTYKQSRWLQERDEAEAGRFVPLIEVGGPEMVDG